MNDVKRRANVCAQKYADASGVGWTLERSGIPKFASLYSPMGAEIQLRLVLFVPSASQPQTRLFGACANLVARHKESTEQTRPRRLFLRDRPWIGLTECLVFQFTRGLVRETPSFLAILICIGQSTLVPHAAHTSENVSWQWRTAATRFV